MYFACAFSEDFPEKDMKTLLEEITMKKMKSGMMAVDKKILYIYISLYVWLFKFCKVK